MHERPIHNLKLNKTDTLIEYLCLILVMAIWVLTITSYYNLPDIIPIHYNELGKIDRYGSKENILTLPILSTIFYIILSILNKYPQIHNFPRKMTSYTTFKEYTYSTKMIRYLKLIIIIVLGFIEIYTINIVS
jgi:uncharacterized membrane protein